MEYRVDWVEKYGKMGEKYPFWAFSGDMYQYMLGSGHFGPACCKTREIPISGKMAKIVILITKLLFRLKIRNLFSRYRMTKRIARWNRLAKFS